MHDHDTSDLRHEASNDSRPPRVIFDEERTGPGVLADRAARAPRRPPWNRRSAHDLKALLIVCSFGLALMLLIALNMK